MGMMDWAKREVEIACKKEDLNRQEEEFDYGCFCYESALKAFKSLCEDEHSCFSIKMTQAILNRLLNGEPLTPIDDTDDVWDKSRADITGFLGEKVNYQCNRMFSLFKYIYPDGSVRYHDNNRAYCVNIHNPESTYSFGLVSKIIDEMFPITMPYMPGKAFRVYCEGFVTDNFDTFGIYYALKEENGEQKRIEINRFFREGEPDESEKWIEISVEEYEKRRAASES